MRRFIVKQNIQRFEHLLDGEVDGPKRAQLEALLSEARRESKALEGVWSWTCPHLGISDVVGGAAEMLLDEVIKAHGANFASLQVWDEADRGLYLVAHHFDQRSAEQFAVVRDGDGTVCEAAQAAQAPVIIDDIEDADTFASLRKWTRAVGIRAIHTTPLFGRAGDFVGAFSTHYASPRVLTSRENEMNATYASRFSGLFAGLGRP